jgi:hypothetical protein
MICPTCIECTAIIARTILFGNTEREKVFTALLEKHNKECHKIPRFPFAEWMELERDEQGNVIETVGSEG